MGGVLAILEQRGGRIRPVSREVLAAARIAAGAAGGEVHALLIGPPGLEPADEDTRGAAAVFLALHEGLAPYRGETWAHVAAAHAARGGYETVLVAATALGRDLAPRLAARLQAALATDVTALAHEDGFVVRRPVYGGKLLRTERLERTPRVVSVRPRQFAPIGTAPPEPAERREVEVDGSVVDAAGKVELRGAEREALDVAEASIVVSGGRGVQEPEKFKLIEDLAAAFDGAVGASRAVVDAGWRSHAEQVGQTGKTVAPELYIAVGISGAIQHVAGMRTARVIVAINKDPDAPIFKLADYGIVGDLFEIVPLLTEAVRRARES